MTRLDIISGFLGAGKTTLCNLLLKHYLGQGQRPVYIVNDFGKVGLDAKLIRSEGFFSVQMEGGCICCTLKDDVARTVKMVIKKYNPTHIVFEPSGVFTFDNFFDIVSSAELNRFCEIGVVITVVDCVNFNTSKIAHGSFIYNQIINSPVLVLSKTNKASQTTEEIICDIKNINPEAIVVSKPWEDFNDNDYELMLINKAQFTSAHNAHHHSRLKTVTVKMQNDFTQKYLVELSSYIKGKKFGDIYRGKGIVRLDGKLVLINIVGNDITILDFKGVADTNFTFIGESIEEKLIKQFFTEIYNEDNTIKG